MNTPHLRPAPNYCGERPVPRHRPSTWRYGKPRGSAAVLIPAPGGHVCYPGQPCYPPGGHVVFPPGGSPPGGHVFFPPGLAGADAGSERPIKGMGCLPDVPDHRDRTFERFCEDFRKQNGKLTKAAANMVGFKHLSKLDGGSETWQAQLKELAEGLNQRCHLGDLKGKNTSRLLPPVEDQGSLNSCSANVVIGMLEYLIRASGGEAQDLSQMFLYKLARMLDGAVGDTGTYLRSAIKALRLFGAPPEEYWPYEPGLLDAEPGALQFAFGSNYKAISYYRIDQEGFSGWDTLDLMRLVLADRFPIAFGFSLFQSIAEMGPDCVIPFPGGEDEHEKQLGSHAVLAVGYDDSVKIPYRTPPPARPSAARPKTREKERPEEKLVPYADHGALIIRNSWGSEWGDWGYAYLPYRYVLDRLVVDCWTILKADSLPMN